MTVSGASALQNVTPGLVCAHHHLYSALARGMPAPPETPTSFLGVLEQIWWRLDTALDLYEDRETWRRIMHNGMTSDFSWRIQGREYERLYDQLAAGDS